MTKQQNMPDVSISIVSFNTRDLIKLCLESIKNLSPSLNVETVVVDNASTDGSSETIKNEFPWVVLIENSKNRYFGPANNQAFEIAKGRYVAILNSDTKLFPDTLERLVSFMEKHPEAGAITCEYLRENGRQLKAEAHNYWNFHSLVYCTLCRNSFGEKIYGLFNKSSSGKINVEYNEYCEADVISDTLLFVKKNILDSIGGYDERFLLYSTEDDICARIKNLGYKIYYVPQAKLIHSLSASVHRSNPFRIRWIYTCDTIKYFHKHGRYYEKILAIPMLISAYCFEVFVYLGRNGKWKRESKK